jgi:hypothetical protein
VFGSKPKIDTSRFVHEHLVRERSDDLAAEIDLAKLRAKDGEMATVSIRASPQIVDYWINWLYGQPVINSPDDWTDYADELLDRIVDAHDLAYQHGDCECINACLDAIRGALVEKRAKLEDPLTLLLHLFEGDSDKTRDMLLNCLAYGPCVDSGEIYKWLDMFDVTREDVPDGWTLVYQKLCRALVARCAAKTPGNSKDVPDFMAPHAYHFCKNGEKLCCGRDAEGQEMDQD